MTLDKPEGFIVLLLFNYVYLGGGRAIGGGQCVCVSTGTWGGQRHWPPGARELELQVVASCLIWTLGTEFRSSCPSPPSHLSNSRISSTQPAYMALLQTTDCPPASSGHTSEVTIGCMFLLTTAAIQKLMGVVPRKIIHLPSS